MKIKGSTYFAAFFFLLSLYVVVKSATFHRWESMVLPLFLGSIMLIMSGLELGRDIRGKSQAQAPAEEKPEKKQGTGIETRRFGLALGWVIAFSLAIYLLGFLIAMPLFTIAYMRASKRGWVVAIVLAAVVTISIYSMFELGLRAPLYDGLVWKLIFP